LRVEGLGLGLRVKDLGLGFRVKGLGFRVKGLELGVRVMIRAYGYDRFSPNMLTSFGAKMLEICTHHGLNIKIEYQD